MNLRYFFVSRLTTLNEYATLNIGDEKIYLDFSIGDYHLFPKWLKFYVAHWNIPPTDYAVIAVHENEVVGLFKFKIRRYANIPRELISKVTLVHPDFRGKGIAEEMWELALHIFPQAKKITAFASTPKGKKFLKKMQKTKSEYEWKIEKTFDYPLKEKYETA